MIPYLDRHRARRRRRCGYARTSSTASSACPCGCAPEHDQGGDASMSQRPRRRRRPSATLRGQGVRAVRLLYTDLHGVARGKDIPIGHFAEHVRGGRRVLRRRDGHRPAAHARRRRRGRATSTSPIRPDLDTLRAVPWQPEVAWCLGEAWTLDGSEPLAVVPARAARAGRRRATRTRGLDADRRPRSSSSSSAERDPSAHERPPPLRRRALARLHGRRRLRSARDRAHACCSGATSSACRRSPRTTSS